MEVYLLCSISFCLQQAKGFYPNLNSYLIQKRVPKSTLNPSTPTSLPISGKVCDAKGRQSYRLYVSIYRHTNDISIETKVSSACFAVDTKATG